MIVEGPNRVRDHKLVVLRMDMAVEELVLVHVSMHKILPCVHHEHGNNELHDLDQDRRLSIDPRYVGF